MVGGRRYSKHHETDGKMQQMLLADCLRQRVAVWAWSSLYASVSRLFFTCQGASVHAHLSLPSAWLRRCILKLAAMRCQQRPRVRGHVALPCRVHFCQGEISISCLAAGHDVLSFISLLNTTNGVLASLSNAPSSISLLPFRHARLFPTSTRCLTFLVLLDRTSNNAARLQRSLLLPPVYTNGPASIRPVRWPESLYFPPLRSYIHKKNALHFRFLSHTTFPHLTSNNTLIIAIHQQYGLIRPFSGSIPNNPH